MVIPSEFKFLCSLAAACLAIAIYGWAMKETDIPTDAPQDAVMASAAEVQEISDWASVAFDGAKPPGHGPTVRVELRRQDHSVLRFRQSCMETPMRIDTRELAHGLGTRANSEVVLHLPPGAKNFHAFAGIDNNFDAEGKRGSGQFSVEIAGKVVFRTPTLKGGDAPAPVNVDLPAGTREITLQVDATPDGSSHDQADWADARVALDNGKTVWADDDRIPFISGAPPFSFVYDGVPSAQLLPTWERMVETKTQNGREVHTAQWADAKTGLRVTATVTMFARYPAVEWVLHFENAGTQDTPMLENVQALDAQLRTGYYHKPAILHQISGDVCGEQSFLPVDTALEAGKLLAFAPVGGRPSNQTFPFFNVQYGDEGVITAVGWSGQWAARLERFANSDFSGSWQPAIELQLTDRVALPWESINPAHRNLVHVLSNCGLLQWRAHRTIS